MQIQRDTGVSNFRLFDRGQEIGYIDDRLVGFRGFASSMDAGTAAWAASQELTLRSRHRQGAAPTPPEAELVLIEREPGELVVARYNTVASLVRIPGDAIIGGEDEWGFEIEVPMDAGPELFVMAQARIMWRGLRARGVQRRMAQFAATATV
ncbi:MAG: hypothetical protein ABI587_04060 [Gemmatimonadales bacterium]